MKVKKGKFIRNIFIGIIALLIVAFIINIAPGFKRNKYSNVINLVIGDTNVTEDLKHEILTDENGKLYISKDDIQSFLDKTIYYDANENTIIVTSEVAVAKIDSFKARDQIIYIPIDDVKVVYNIEVKYIEDTHVLIIDKLNEGMIKAQAQETTKIRFKQRNLSKVVGELKAGETVSAFYTTSKGWRMIRTEDGTVGYVKANTLGNEYILRQDMNQKPETKTINISIADNAYVELDGSKVLIKDLLKMTDEGILLKNTDIPTFQNDEITIWADLSVSNVDLSTFANRTKIIRNILSISMRNNIKGINVVLIENNDNIERFIIELAPRLREIGIKTNIVENNYLSNINMDLYNEIVDYVIKEK